MSGQFTHLHIVPAGSVAVTAQHRGDCNRSRRIKQLGTLVGAAAGTEGRVPGGHRRARRLRYRAARHRCALASRLCVCMSLPCPCQMSGTVKAAPHSEALTKRLQQNLFFWAACVSCFDASLSCCRRRHGGDAAAGSCGRHAPGGRAWHGAACDASTFCGEHLSSRLPMSTAACCARRQLRNCTCWKIGSFPLVHVQVALMQHARLSNVDWKLAAGGHGRSDLELDTLRV